MLAGRVADDGLSVAQERRSTAGVVRERSGPLKPSDEESPVVIARYGRRHEAEFARGFLEDAGIPAVVAADDAGGADLGLGFARSVPLLVRSEDAERARRVLREVDLPGEAS